MKNTIHFFGDSFTEGYTLRATEHIWTKIIHEALPEYNYINYAWGGASPTFIIKQFIDSLTKVKKGDKAILLETIPNRIEIYSPQEKIVIPATNGHIIEAFNNKKSPYFKSFKHIKTALDFILDHREENIEDFEKFYRDINNTFLTYLDSIGVETILIPWQVSFGNMTQGKFQTLKELSKDKHIDEHFTVLGHWQFANYVNKTYFNSKLKLRKKPKENMLI
jgi:hypothetical protein